MRSFIIIIWHQAGGRDDNTIFYTWQDENENTLVFNSESDAKEAWIKRGMREIHAGFIVECTPEVNNWI